MSYVSTAPSIFDLRKDPICTYKQSWDCLVCKSKNIDIGSELINVAVEYPPFRGDHIRESTLVAVCEHHFVKNDDDLSILVDLLENNFRAYHLLLEKVEDRESKSKKRRNRRKKLNKYLNTR